MSMAGTVGTVRAGLADPLADVEHRRLVALALADDDAAGELDLVHGLAHRLGGRGVGLVLGAPTHEPRRLDRGGLRDADHLQREQLLHYGRPTLITDQWLKCRLPVNTIARWCRSATSIAISSRMEPPGWMIAVMPGRRGQPGCRRGTGSTRPRP